MLIFSLSHSVFKAFMVMVVTKSRLHGKRLALFHTIPTFNDPKEEDF